MAKSTIRNNKAKGAKTQWLVAEWYRVLWPTANSQAGSTRGRDVRDVPADIEVKFRKDFAPLAWLKQARDRGQLPTDVLPPWVVMRPFGLGETLEAVPQYLVIRRLSDDTAILKELLDLRRRVAELGGLPETQEAVSGR
jgi:hypothetical protein